MGIKLAGKSDDSDKETSKKQAKKERKPGELSRFQKTVIIIFVVVFALSTLAGALASVFQSTQSQEIEYNVDYIDSQFEPSVSDLESQVEASPEDTSLLRSLGDGYMQWGSYVMVLATTDEETSHANDLFNKAIATYDDLLALGEDSDVSVNRAMCEYYKGDYTAATNDLEALTEADPDHASAWLNLGIVNEAQGETEDAIAAYEKAVELDPEDDQGVKSSAQSRLDALQGTDEDEEGDDASSDEGSETSDEDSADADN